MLEIFGLSEGFDKNKLILTEGVKYCFFEREIFFKI